MEGEEGIPPVCVEVEIVMSPIDTGQGHREKETPKNEGDELEGVERGTGH